MNTAMPVQQRGFTIGGFVVGIFIFVLLGITAIKLIPAYMQAAKIKNIFVTIAHEPDMQKATIHDIQESFSKRATMDSISAISVGDIDISTDGGTPVLSASYAVKVPLVANISIYMEFNPSSAGK